MFKRRNKVPAGGQDRHKPLLLWPGVFIVLLQWLVRFGIPLVVPGDTVTAIGVFGGLIGGLAVVVWWAFFSRASRFERWGAILLMIVSLFAASRLIHLSIATAMQGLMFTVYAVPVLSLAFVVWAAVTRHFSDRLRRVTMVATILIACGVWTLLRTDGMTGEARHDIAWRWAETAEERLLSRAGNEPMALMPVSAVTDSAPEWPGFRGPNRDGIVRGVHIGTDWSASPPVELWRRPVGPGCSSFAVHGNLLYTQEQRGDDEVVSCYNLTTGEPVWRHGDAARFWDAHAGAGPRSTPTLSEGRVCTFGATGILNVLNAADGSLVWSRNAASDAGTKDSGWGFTSSPLVAGDLVIVAAIGKLVAYDISTGDISWSGPDGGDSYSSPQLLTIGGVPQVLLMSGAGATSVAPSDGKLLWKHQWTGSTGGVEGTRIVQPALVPDGDILISGPDGKGIRRLSLANGPDGWTVVERWTSVQLRPNFNDFVIHKGHAFGFNGPMLTCIDIADGSRNWRGGRYAGFLLLLADQDLLLILSEAGELVLVGADPGQFTELARIQAIGGKTWSHPVLAGDVLLVRNAREMAAFRLSQR